MKTDIRQNLQTQYGLISKKIKTVEETERDMTLFKIQKLRTFEEENFINKKMDSDNFHRIFDFQNEQLKEFKMLFSFGFDSYVKGNWAHAKKFFQKALGMRPNDKPTNVLWDYMNEFDFNAPKDWSNCREFIE